MTKKKKITLIVLAVIVVALGSFCLWYTRPMTLEELCPDFDWTACDEICLLRATYHTTGLSRDQEEYQFTLTPDNPDFSRILSKFQNQTFRRSLLGLLPGGVSTHRIQEGDFSWYLCFHTDTPLPLPGGDTLTGDILRFKYSYGKMYISDVYTDKTWRCTTPDFSQWSSEIMEIIRAYSDDTD